MREIDIDALRDLRASQANLAAETCAVEKRRQNTALVAAGLKPMYSDSLLDMYDDMAARTRRHIEALDAVLEMLAIARAE